MMDGRIRLIRSNLETNIMTFPVFYLIQQSFVQIYIHHLEKQLVVKKSWQRKKKYLSD